MNDKRKELLEQLNGLEGEMIEHNLISQTMNPFHLDDSENKNLVIGYTKEMIEHIIDAPLSSSDCIFITNIYNENHRNINRFEDLAKLMKLQNVKTLSEQKIVESLTKFIEDFVE